MSRTTFLAFTCAALAIGTLASTSASAKINGGGGIMIYPLAIHHGGYLGVAAGEIKNGSIALCRHHCW
jgi:hypothetical protein